MALVLSAGGAALLAWTVAFVAGRTGGWLALLLGFGCSAAFDRSPVLFFLLSLVYCVLVRASPSQALWTAVGVPAVSVGVLLFARASLTPTFAIWAVDAVLIAVLAYRGWANKQLVD